MTGVLVASGVLYLTREYRWAETGDLFRPEYLEQVLELAEGFTDHQPTHFFVNGERFEKVVLDNEEERL